MKISVPRDAEGYLMIPEDLDKNIAFELAKEEGIELSEDYWTILGFIRTYYDEHAITPDIRHVITYLANEHGWEKSEAKKFIFKLFPFGYVKQACKISGMRRPRAWSTG